MTPLEKRQPVRLKKLRDSARGRDCTIQSQYCNGNPESVVLAHYGEAGEKGMGYKPSDTSAAFACSSCHDYVDRRTHASSSQYEGAVADVEIRWLWFRAMRKTWEIWVREGILK